MSRTLGRGSVINSGEGTVVIENDRIYVVKRGDLIIYNVGKVHAEISSPGNPLPTYFFGAENIYIGDLPENTLLSKANILLFLRGKNFLFFSFTFPSLSVKARTARIIPKRQQNPSPA
jgi:hypothetical protein